jgi:outer membrane protein assembly factor BamB
MSHLFTIRASTSEVTHSETWTNKARGYMSSPVVIDGHLYLHLQNQRFTCINLKTGETCWTTTPYGKYWSLVVKGDRILALDERGDLLLIRANPEKFELLDTRKVSNEPTWAHLAVCGSEIFIRELNAITKFEWK